MASEIHTCRLLALLTFVAVAYSQALFTTPDASVPDDPHLCNTSIGNANRTGIYPFAVEYPKQDGSILPELSWAITVTLRQGEKTRTSIWYDTAGERYDRDLEINYDVCAFIVSDLPENAYLLGQKDPGDCSTMLTPTCAAAINSKAASSALQWASYTGPNMTEGILPGICQNVAQDIREEMQRECTQEFGMSPENPTGGATIFDIALTGNNLTNLDNSQCDLTSVSPTKHFSRVTTKTQPSTEGAFYNATLSIYPILTVHMPVANADRKGEIYSRANSSLQCIRAGKVGQVSIDIDPLPPGVPWEIKDEDKSGLSAGATGGIAAGAAVVILLVVGCTVWLYLRKRSRRLGMPLEIASVGTEPKFETGTRPGTESETAFVVDPAKEHSVQLGGAAMPELSGDGRPVELGHS